MKLRSLIASVSATAVYFGAVCHAVPLTAPTASKLTMPTGAKAAGTSVAVNEGYIAVGAPDSTAGGVNDAGEVLIYRVSDGVLLRRIQSPAPVFGGAFGLSVALYGGTVYVGAPGQSVAGATNSGYVYAMNVTTGAKVWATSGAAGQRLGGTLALSGDLLLVGAPAGNLSGRPSLSGSATLINRRTGASLDIFELSGSEANDRFGAAVAISGTLVAIGAPGKGSSSLNSEGVVMLMDIADTNTPVIATLACPDLQLYTEFGSSVAITRETVLVGSPGFNGFYPKIGRVDAFSTTGTFLRKLDEPHADNFSRRQLGRSLAASGWLCTSGMLMHTDTDGQVALQDIRGSRSYVELAPHTDADGSNFGRSVAMDDQTIVIGDDTQPVSGSPGTIGAVWVLRQPRQPMQSSFLFAKTGDAAPGLFNIQYKGFSDACMSELFSSEVMFRATLKGQGVSLATDTAIFNNWSGSLQELLIREGSSALGTVSAFGKPYFTSGNDVAPILPTTIGSKARVLRDTGSALETDIMIGATPANVSWGGSIAAIKSSTTGTDVSSTLFVYNAKPGIAGATSSNDTRIAAYAKADGAHKDIIVEGTTSPDTARAYGQIASRISAAKGSFVFSTGLSGSSAGNSALVLKKDGNAAAIIAQKGQTVAGLPVPLSSFVGAGVNRDGSVVYRTILAGGTECLLLKLHNGGTAKVALKGDLAPGAGAGVRFASFSRYFIGPDNTVLFMARLTGMGVNLTNDVGVWLKTNSATHLLMREGSPARDCGGALIATIQNVELGTVHGAYAILATLTGPTSQNQAAFFGYATATKPGLLAPRLNLRKGMWIDRLGGQRVTSIGMGSHHIDPSGCGSTGRARLVNGSAALLTVKYSDNTSELRTLAP